MMKKFLYKLTAVFVAALTALSVSIPAFAADGVKNDGGAGVTYDESLYVTLDYYGNREKLSVVKGVNLNGNKEFTDYGSYKSVQNMSGYAKPQVNDDSVTWKLGDDFTANRMYFEGVPKSGNIQIPWSFNVTYKLNGVPAKAEKLAGEKGTVEIIVECKPNADAGEYEKNNMMLQLVTMVDTEKVLSVEAPGAQTQAVGKYKAVLFAALPGEAITFNIRIGTESFESLGLIMLMEPATLYQMNQLKELREMKDTIGDAPALLLNGMGSMLSSVQNMAGSISQVSSGFGSLQNAYNNAMQYSGDISVGSQNTIASLSALSKSLSEVMPYLNGTSDAVRALSALFEKMQSQLPGNISTATAEDVLSSTKTMKSQMKQASEYLESAQKDSSKINTLAADAVSRAAAENVSSSTDLTDSAKALDAALADNKSTMGILDGGLDSIIAALEGLAGIITDPAVIETLKNVVNELGKLVQSTADAGKALTDLTASSGILFGDVNNAVVSAGSELHDGITKMLSGLSGIGSGANDLDSASSDLQSVGETLQGAIDKAISDMTSNSNMLNIDTSAAKKSFTSEKNSEPGSSQILLRTKTIGLSLMQENENKKDEPAQTPWGRIKQVFIKIGKAIKTLFE